MGTYRSLSRGVALAASILAVACSGQEITPPPDGGEVELVVTANLAGTAATTVVVEVTAADIPTPLTFNLTVDAGVASGTVTVTAGSDRTFTVKAYNADGILTHTGSVTMDVMSGNSSPVAITLDPETGDIEITVTIGSITITVTAATSTTITVGSTVQLSAEIQDVDGNSVTGTVAWATQAPGIATVDQNGLVTGTGVGTTNVVATFEGAAGAIGVTVN